MRIVLPWAILLSISACARTGPTSGALLAPQSGDGAYRLIEITAATIAPFALTQTTPGMSAPGTRVAERAPSSGYSIAPGDLLNIVIFERSDGGLFAPAAAGGSSFPAVRVDDGGAVTLPYAGRVRVAGSSLARAAAAISAALAGTVIDPRVHVALVSSTVHSVLVSGEVRTPGRVSLLDGPLTAVDAIARAGGPAQPAHALNAVIHGAGGTTRLAYSDLLAQPGLFVRVGDQIILEPNERRFLVMGAVQRPGLLPMTLSRMSLLDGLGSAGGLSDRAANPSGVFLMRLADAAQGSGAQPTVFHLDMARGEAMLLAHRFALLPDDIIYISNAPLWEVQKLLAPFVPLLTLGAAGAAAAGG